METTKRIALVAHDNCKKDMVEWVDWNSSLLVNHKLVCTGTTGRLVGEALAKKMGSASARRVDSERPDASRFPDLGH